MNFIYKKFSKFMNVHLFFIFFKGLHPEQDSDMHYRGLRPFYIPWKKEFSKIGMSLFCRGYLTSTSFGFPGVCEEFAAVLSTSCSSPFNHQFIAQSL